MTTAARQSFRNERVVCLLDIGSSKIACLVVAIDARATARHEDGWTTVQPDPGSFGSPAPGVVPNGAPMRVLGVGYTRSQGIKSGVITDMASAEAVVRTCVAQAEIAAGVTVERVHVAVSCGRLRSQSFAAHADIGPAGVNSADISRAFAGGRAYVHRKGRCLLHMNCVGFRLDGEPCGLDPRGSMASRLSADLHAVAADDVHIQAVLMLMQRCHLIAEDVTPVPYASGLASTLVDERKLGVTVIDLGSGTSTFAVFADDHLLHVDALAIGADQITFDLARQLETPLAQAERIKALYGTMVVAASDSNEIVSYQTLSNPGEMCGRVSRSELSAIMVPRVQWLLSELRTRMDACPVRSYAGDRIVLTGGGSQIVGLDVFAADFLKRPVRIGVPQPIEGAPAEFSHPAFSGLFGLASTILRRPLDTGGLARVPNSGSVEPGGYLSRVGQWLVGAG